MPLKVRLSTSGFESVSDMLMSVQLRFRKVLLLMFCDVNAGTGSEESTKRE